jgi:release factor glutamine methyltransferase
LTRSVVARLAAAGCVAPDDEARELLHDGPEGAELETRLRRREAGEPVEWITGRANFGGLIVRVDRGVYVPRSQTEELARRAASLLPARGTAVDLCTGSGAVATWLQHAAPRALVVGVDVDLRAARCAASNRVPVVVGDLAKPLHALGTVDVVTAVAPYVPTSERRLLPADVQRHEPAHALDGGEDGLVVVRRVVEHAATLLRPGGQLVLELGGDQDVALMPSLERNGFTAVEPWHDDDGDLRGVIAVRRAGREPAWPVPTAGTERAEASDGD